MVVTGRRKDTRRAVASVRARVESQDPAVSAAASEEIQRIGELTESVLSLATAGAGGESADGCVSTRKAPCSSDDETSFFDLINRAQGSLRALGVSCDEIETVVSWLRGEGWAAAKLTGAGQGGAVLGFGRPAGRGEDAHNAPREALLAFETELGGPGLIFSAEKV